MTGHAADHGQTHCPRCGYDLRGTVESWREQCPLDGCCTECGYEFEWADLFDQSRNLPDWCVEGGNIRDIVRLVPATLARSFLPWKFWARIHLSHSVRYARLSVYVLMLSVLVLVQGYVMVQSGTAVSLRLHMQAQINETVRLAPMMTSHWRSRRAAWDDVRMIADIAPGELAQFRWFLGVQNIDEFLKMSQQEWEPLWHQYADMLDARVDESNALLNHVPEIRHPLPIAIFEAVFLPMRDQSFGRIVWADQTQPYIAPSQLHRAGMGMGFRPWYWSSTVQDAAFILIVGTIIAFIFLTLFPTTYVLLPISRRRARVRARHFVRITAYSSFFPLLALCIGSALLWAASFWSGLEQQLKFWIFLVNLLGPLVLLMTWWYFAVRLHLRLPRALFQVIVLTILTMLFIAATYWVTGTLLGSN